MSLLGLSGESSRETYQSVGALFRGLYRNEHESFDFRRDISQIPKFERPHIQACRKSGRCLVHTLNRGLQVFVVLLLRQLAP